MGTYTHIQSSFCVHYVQMEILACIHFSAVRERIHPGIHACLGPKLRVLFVERSSGAHNDR